MNSTIKFVAAILIFLHTSPSLAGRDTGNGGDSVEMNGQQYLLDLVEFGNYAAPYFDSGAVADPKDLERLHVLGDVQVNRALVARKISQVRAYSPGLAEAMLRAISMLRWQAVAYPLEDAEDENTIVKLPRVQVAIRVRDSIMINLLAFAGLNEENRVALIFHEVIYSLLRPEIRHERGIKTVHQQSSVAREINSYLFSPQLAAEKAQGLSRRLRSLDGTYRLPFVYAITAEENSQAPSVNLVQDYFTLSTGRGLTTTFYGDPDGQFNERHCFFKNEESYPSKPKATPEALKASCTEDDEYFDEEFGGSRFRKSCSKVPMLLDLSRSSTSTKLEFRSLTTSEAYYLDWTSRWSNAQPIVLETIVIPAQRWRSFGNRRFYEENCHSALLEWLKKHD